MAFPAEIIGEIPVYILEIFAKGLVLCVMMGVSSFFILSTLTICTHFKILAVKLENVTSDNPEVVEGLIEEHKRLIE